MPTNSQVVAGLVAQTVPPDRECITNLTQVLQGAVDYLSVIVNTQTIPGSPGGDSIAQQALQVAQLALTTAQQAVAAIPPTRSDQAIALPTGDSTIALSWADPLPDTNYAVIGTYIGAAPSVATYYTYRIIDGTQTTTGVQIRFENTPANFKWTWVVQAIKSAA